MPTPDHQTITKKAFIEKLSHRLGEDPKICQKVFLETLDLIVEEIQAGSKLEFRGTFILGPKFLVNRLA